MHVFCTKLPGNNKKKTEDVSAPLCLKQNERKSETSMASWRSSNTIELESFEIKCSPIPFPFWTIFIFIGLNRMQKKLTKFTEYFRWVKKKREKYSTSWLCVCVCGLRHFSFRPQAHGCMVLIHRMPSVDMEQKSEWIGFAINCSSDVDGVIAHNSQPWAT